MDIVGIIISLVVGILLGAGVLYFMMNKLLQSEKSERFDDRSQVEKKIIALETEKNTSLEKAKEEAERIIVRAKYSPSSGNNRFQIADKMMIYGSGILWN